MRAESLSLVSDILTSKLRRDDAGIVEWWAPVADMLATDGQFIELESMGRMVYERVSRNKGASSEDAFAALTIWARGAFRNGDAEGVINTLEPIIETFVGPTTRARRYLRGALAVALWRQKQLDRSLVILEGLYADAAAELGDSDPEVATYANNLSTLYREVGRPRDAIALLEEVERAGSLVGEVAITAKLNLAQARLDIGDPHSAMPLFDAATTYFGSKNRVAEEATALHGWSLATGEAGYFDLVTNTIEKKVERFATVLGPAATEVLLLEEILAYAYFRLGDLQRALQLQTKILNSLTMQDPKSERTHRAKTYLDYYQAERAYMAIPGKSGYSQGTYLAG